MALVLAIEDDADVRRVVRTVLEKRRHRVAEAANAADGLAALDTEPIEAVVLDLTLEDMDGMTALDRIKEIDPTLPVVILTGRSGTADVVKAIKQGADEYLVKPFSNQDLSLAVEKALMSRTARKEVEALRLQIGSLQGKRAPVGMSSAIRKALEQVRTVAPTDLTVILEGPSGAGKEVFANLLHRTSLRAQAPFVALDCGALPENLVETELFGFEKGAFTGADKRKPGLLEAAFQGTLFLDEINNLTLPIQAKLLRTLQEQRVRHVGGKKDVPVDVRIIVAANSPLMHEVETEKFRNDLFHRLNQFTIRIPPLKERLDDIPELAAVFLDEANRILHKSVSSFSDEALERLRRHDWPGNVRELRNVVLRAVLAAKDRVEGGDVELPSSGAAGSEPLDLKAAVQQAVETTERRLIREALTRTEDNKAAAAKLLGIDRKALYNKLSKYSLP